MKEFDLESLAEFNGKGGKPVYIAHQGGGYDVSESALWKGGVHMRRHHAGNDLSVDIGAAPHGTEVLDRFPQVGVIRGQGAKEPAGPEFLLRLLERFPMLRRHPHPMTVHFPIALIMTAVGFNVLYVLTGCKSLEVTGFHCLTVGMVFTPLVILTGLFTWWLNYLARPLRAVTIKIGVSLLLFVSTMIVLAWRSGSPDIMDAFNPVSFFYFLLLLSLVPMVSVIGWFGAKLTFPVEAD
ncbi:MAG: cytochrome b5 [Syntrophobacteraceae bacterium]|nr:cytochrome b5 [Syntrophobacteraceae bacterium]